MRFNPRLELIQPFSSATARRAPYVALFKKSQTRLCFIAAKHGAPETLEAVRQAFDEFKPQVVIVEGISKEISPAEYLERCRRQSLNGFKQGGEGSLATVLAGEHGIDFIPGEPTDREIHQSVLAQGKTTEDLLGSYTALILQQKNRGGSVLKPEDVPQAIQETLGNYSKRFGLEKPFGFQEFRAWYERRMGKKFDPEGILHDDLSPSNAGKANFLQKMTYATDQSREPNILKTIAGQLSKHKRVLVVYGASHFDKQERVLRDMLGSPEIQAITSSVNSASAVVSETKAQPSKSQPRH